MKRLNGPARLWIAAALLLGLATSAAAQAAKTRVIDYARDASGNPLSGKVTFILMQKSAPSADGPVVAGPAVSAMLDGTGKLDVWLYPSVELSPASYYQVYVTGGAGSQIFLGVYNIPASVSPVTLAPYKVKDANLAAQHTFASLPAVNALATAAGTLGAAGVANHALLRDAGGSVAASGASDNGSTFSTSRETAVTGNVMATNYIGNGSALTGVGVGTSTGHSAAVNVSLVFDNDNSGGNDDGGVLDIIQGSTTRGRVNNGQLEVVAGLKVSGGAIMHQGSYLDLRPAAAQQFTYPGSNLIGIGANAWANLYHQPTPVNGLQFGAAFAIESGGTNTTPAGFPDNSKVALSAFAQNTPGASSTAAMYAANFIIQQNATGSDLMMTGLEVDCNRNNTDAAYDYPTHKSVCSHIVNGGSKHMQYGQLFQGNVNPGGGQVGKFLTVIRIASSAAASTGIQIGDVSTEGGANLTGGLVMRQFGNTGQAVVVQRATDASPSGNAFGVRNAANSAWLATIGVTGDITTAGFLNVTSGVVQLDSLPTADPLVPGRLWRSGNNLKISTGP